MYPQNHQYRFSNYQGHSGGQQSPYYYTDHQPDASIKTDRRVWDKSTTDINLEYPDAEKMAANLKRYDDYLFNLEINNKIQKLASQKDEKHEKLEKLEAGFNVYVNGAHQKPERYTPRYTLTKSSSTASASASNDVKKIVIPRRANSRRLEVDNLRQYDLLMNMSARKAAKSSAIASKNGSGRKKWVRCSFILKTEEGYEIKINAPKPSREVKSADAIRHNKKNVSNDYYSDDFESDSESEEAPSIKPTNSSDVIQKELIESVQFSNESGSSDSESIAEEISHEDDQKKKKLVVNLNKNDLKTLRESINILSLESDTDSQGKIGEFKNAFDTKDDSICEVDEEQIAGEDKSPICDLIIKQVVHLKPKERSELVNFLNKIDTNQSKDQN